MIVIYNQNLYILITNIIKTVIINNIYIYYNYYDILYKYIQLVSITHIY